MMTPISWRFMREIGLWLDGSFWSLFGLGIITIVASFYFSGKCLSLRHELKILVMYNKFLLERCFKAVFVMLSGPGALLRGRYLIIFLISPGEIDCIWDGFGELSYCIVFETAPL